MRRSLILTELKVSTTCARCGELIATGPCFSVRRNETGSLSEERKLLRFHPQCALDLDPIGAVRAAEQRGAVFPGGAVLEALARQRVASVLDRAEQRWEYDLDAFGRMVMAKPPRKALHDNHTAVAFAKDNHGRPCVRVLCAGSVLREQSLPIAPLSRLLPTLTWASSRREYQFVLPNRRWALPDEDPARPFIATLFAMRAHENSARLGTQHLVLWRSLDLPAPLLWIVGGPDNKTRDSYTLRAREALDQSAYSPDESQVVHSAEVSAEALDALVGALDERFVDGVELREREEPYYATAKLLFDTVCEYRRERVDHILAATNLAGDVHSTRADPLIATSANWLMDRGRSWDAAKLATNLSNRDLSVFRRVFFNELFVGGCNASLLRHVTPMLFRDEATAPSKQLIVDAVSVNDPKRLEAVAKAIIQLQIPAASRALYRALDQVLIEDGVCAANARDLMLDVELLRQMRTASRPA